MTYEFLDERNFGLGINGITMVDSDGVIQYNFPRKRGFPSQFIMLDADGQLTFEYLDSVEAATVADGSLTYAKFAQSIEPVGLEASLPNPIGYVGPSIVFNTTNEKLYRYVDGNWVSAVDSVDIPDFSISEQKIQVAAVGVTQIKDGSISTPKLFTNAVTADKIATNAITADKIATNAVTASKIQANAITANKIAANAITAEKIATNAITSDKILANSITAGKIAAGAISSTQLSSNEVSAHYASLGTITVQSANIANLSVSNAKIANLAVTGPKIANDAVDITKIAGTLQSTNYSTGVAGWRIQKTGGAEFNGVVLSRQLQVASGSHTIGDFNVQAFGTRISDNGWRLDNFDVYSTGVPISAWAGTNKTYLASISMVGTVFAISNAPPNVWWGFDGKILPLTRWSGTQQLTLFVKFYSRNVTRVEDCTINWKIYEVT